LALRTGRLIRIGQRVCGGGVILREAAQLVEQVPGSSDELGTGVVGDHADEARRPAQPLEVQRSVERVEAGDVQTRGVADVVQPPGRDQQVAFTGSHCAAELRGPIRDADRMAPPVSQIA
jgi:hypothetical protein